MNNRRKLIITLGAGALTLTFGSFAQQQGKVWRLGYLKQSSREPSAPLSAFLQSLRELGYIEGKNLLIEWRAADGKVERLPALAAELVQVKVDVIVTEGTPATKAAQHATSTIPIVFGTVGDPVGSGLIKSLARPGGNITGLSNLNIDLGPKRLEMLLAMVPKLSYLGILVNPDNANGLLLLKQLQRAAQGIGVKVLQLDGPTPQEIEKAFSVMAREKAGAVIVAQDPFLVQQRRQIAELALKQRLPSMSGYGEYVEAGGLMSYGQNRSDNYRQAATYVDKILKGTKPADLPVEEPTKLELIINGKSAKALGLTIPQSLLIIANKIIE